MDRACRLRIGAGCSTVFPRQRRTSENKDRAPVFLLYIVRTLVSFLKGSVAVADVESGTGSVFEITLPGRQLEIPESENCDARQRVSELALSAKENGS